jgi:hypothetical protein
VAGLADLSESGLRLVGEHAGALRQDIQTLADAAATIDANLASVTLLLEGGDLLTSGLLGAYNPEVRAIDLRNNFSPLVTDVVDVLLGQMGLPPVCVSVPVLDCTVIEGQAAEATPAALTTAPPTPVGSLLTLLGSPTAPATADGPSPATVAGRWAIDAAETLLGVAG